MRDDLGISRVGRLTPEHRRRKAGAAEDFVHQAQLDLTEPLPAQLRPKMTGPQPTRLHLFLQRPHQFVAPRVCDIRGVDPEIGQRLHLVAYEAVHPLETLGELRISFEIPGHHDLRFNLGKPAANGDDIATTTAAGYQFASRGWDDPVACRVGPTRTPSRSVGQCWRIA